MCGATPINEFDKLVENWKKLGRNGITIEVNQVSE
jgi:hypothetical protein